MSATWTKLVNMVIRPPRAQYDPSECLPGPRFRIGGVAYRRVDLDLEGARGHLLRCSHYEPEIRGSDPSPCVIYLHGNSGSRCDAVDAVRLLLPTGVSVFALDLGGSGISEGEHVTLGVRETEDVAVVVAHLRAQGRVDRVGIWGQSMGAVTALLYANRDPSIAGIVLDSPFSSLTALMSELADGFFGGANSYVGVPRMATRLALGWMRSSIKSRAGFDIHHLDVLRTVGTSHCPALFAHGADDDFIKPAHSRALHDAYAGEKEFLLFDGDHNSPRPTPFFDATLTFFTRALYPGLDMGMGMGMGAGAGAGAGLRSRQHLGDLRRPSHEFYGGDPTGSPTVAGTASNANRHQYHHDREDAEDHARERERRRPPRRRSVDEPGVIRVRDVLASPPPPMSARAKIDLLVAMGFDAVAAEEALERRGGDVDAAVVALLNDAVAGGDADREEDRGGGGGGMGGTENQSGFGSGPAPRSPSPGSPRHADSNEGMTGIMMDAMARASDADLARAISLSLADFRAAETRGGGDGRGDSSTRGGDDGEDGG